MMDLSSWGLQHSKLVRFAVLVLVVGGAWSAYQMPKLEDPEVKVKLAMVVTAYPGASAHQVELEVTDPLERMIRQVEGVGSVESTSMADVSIIQVELESTVSDDDVEQRWDVLRRKVASARLPKGAAQPMVADDFGNVYGMFYALSGEGYSAVDLTDWADMVKRELEEVDGVERVNLYGTRAQRIDITMNEERMAALSVTPAEVLLTLNQQNATTYAGYQDTPDERVRIAVADRFRTPEDIALMTIQGHDREQLRLGDIATVELAEEQPVRQRMERNAEEAIGILVASASGTDIVKVGRRVEDCLARLAQERLPAGVECSKVFAQPERVTASLGTFVLNLVESVVIVVLVLMVAMGLRSGMLIGASLVVTVMGSFLFLSWANGTMQRVSLGAFVLAMGMLVDNAIVIIDGILVAARQGKQRFEALTLVGKQTAMPLLGATAIAVVAFLPIYLSPDTAGVYTRDLFVVLAVSLLLSWVLALVHVPLMAERRLRLAKSKSPQYNTRVYTLFRRTLNACLRHRLTVVGLSVALLLLSLWAYPRMHQGFFPDMAYDQLYVEYKLPEGTSPDRVLRDLRGMERWLHTRPEVSSVTLSAGATPGRYNLVRNIATPSLSYGELIVDFESAEALERSMQEIQDTLSMMHPEAYVKVKRYNLMFRKYPIEAEFRGSDPAVLKSLAAEARAVMEQEPSVCLVTQDWEPSAPLLEVDYAQSEARRVGISRADVATSVLAANGGVPIGEFYDGTHPLTLYLRSSAASSPSQAFTLLGTAASMRQVTRGTSLTWEDPVVMRHNGRRSIRVQCSPSPGVDTENARKAIAQRIESIPLPPGYRLAWIGEREASQKSMRYLFRSMPLAIVAMLGVLIMLMGDYRRPLVIALCLPLVMVGVVATMLLTQKAFTFVAIVGTLGLMGMIVKNGIVLLDEVGLEISRGVSPRIALVNSAQSRLRPVVLASLTTILGMTPLLPDAMFGSMAAAIMGGLSVGIIVTLLVMPVLYALLHGIKAHN